MERDQSALLEKIKLAEAREAEQNPLDRLASFMASNEEISAVKYGYVTEAQLNNIESINNQISMRGGE